MSDINFETEKVNEEDVITDENLTNENPTNEDTSGPDSAPDETITDPSKLTPPETPEIGSTPDSVNINEDIEKKSPDDIQAEKDKQNDESDKNDEPVVKSLSERRKMWCAFSSVNPKMGTYRELTGFQILENFFKNPNIFMGFLSLSEFKAFTQFLRNNKVVSSGYTLNDAVKTEIINKLYNCSLVAIAKEAELKKYRA